MVEIITGKPHLNPQNRLEKVPLNLNFEASKNKISVYRFLVAPGPPARSFFILIILILIIFQEFRELEPAGIDRDRLRKRIAKYAKPVVLAAAA